MSESSDGIYIEDYEHHEYCERCHHEMALIVGVESYYDSFYCKNCGMNHPLREMRGEVALWLNCPYCAGDRMEALEPSGYICTDCGAKIHPEQLVPSMRKAFYTNDFRGFFSQDNQTVAKNATVQKGEKKVKNDIVFCPFCRNGHLHELKLKKGFWLCDFCGNLYEKQNDNEYIERALACPKCDCGKIYYRFSTNHWHCPSCGGKFDSVAMGLYDGYDIGRPLPENYTGKKCLRCGGEIFRVEDGKLVCPKCKVVYMDKEFLEKLKPPKPEGGFNLYDGYEIGSPVKDDWKEWAKNPIVCPVCHERYLTKVGGKYWRCPYCYSTLDATTESGPARCGCCGGELNDKNVCKDCGAVYESYTDGWNVLRKYPDTKDQLLFKCPVCSAFLKYVGNDMAQCPKCERKFERVSKFACSQCGHEVWKNDELFKGPCPYCGSALENMEDVVGFFDYKMVSDLVSCKKDDKKDEFLLHADDYKMVEGDKGTGKKCLCCGSEIVRGEDGKLACSKCKVVYSGKCNFERGKMVIEGDCKVERPNETLDKEKDLNCPGCGIKLKKVAGDNHLYYCVKCGRCYEDAGAFLVSKPLHCKNCGSLILAYNPKEFKYECPKCEATYYPMGGDRDEFQEEFYMESVVKVKTVPVKDEPKNDAINPQHYKGKGGMQAIDVIEAFGLGFCLGNAVKYILRAGKKDAYEQELKKAIWYIERAIKENSNG